MFGRYVTREVVDELLGSPDGLRLGGEARVVTILVSDLRGFTALAAARAPREVLEILNRYLERMVAVVRRHRGTIDEIQGDGILAFFGAPLAAPDDPVRAVACAIEMQQALAAFNGEQGRLGRPELAMGVGINTGEVIVGNIGSEQRTKYGAVGSPINMAYRIESHTVGGQVLLSPETYARVRDLVELRGTVTAAFKGLDRPLTLYEVAALGGDYRLALPAPPGEELAALEPPIPAACFPIEGKVVATTPIAGRVLRASGAAAALVLETPVAPHTNVKLVLDPASGSEAEVYAKVLPRREGPEGGGEGVRVGLTSVSDAARRLLEARRRQPGREA